MIASHGCIYNCVFCGRANLGNLDIAVRYLSKESIQSGVG